MKSILPVAFALGCMIGAAQAADMPVIYRAAPAVIPTPVYSWTGIYIGVNGGYGRAHGDATLSLVQTPVITPPPVTATGDYLGGGVAGGQVGGNYQLGMVVFGAEFDGQWSGQKVETATGERIEITRFATARGRLGVAFDKVLLYATAGGAWTGVKNTLTGTIGGPIFNVVDTSFSASGWTAGTGIEVAFGEFLSAKFEYLYIATGNHVVTAALPAPLGGGTLTETLRIRDNIFRVGINYRFGGGYGVPGY